MLIFYQYPRCSTCVKARKWLQVNEITFTSIQMVDNPPLVDQIQQIHERSGQAIKKLFNTSGQSYRQGDFKNRLSNMSLLECYQALAADGKLIKRPLLVSDDWVLIGFKEAQWQSTALKAE
jgi:arsenate reductase (glutaredoxin)